MKASAAPPVSANNTNLISKPTTLSLFERSREVSRKKINQKKQAMPIIVNVKASIK